MQRTALLLLVALALAGCSESGKTLESAVEPTPAEQPAQDASQPKIVQQPASVSQKGNFIRLVVNGEPVTNYDVERRTRFRQIRRMSASRDAAEQEMIDQAIKLQEARRLNLLASDEMVDSAFENFAKSNRSTPSRISGDLDRIGIGAQHFRTYIRAQISWNRVVASKLQGGTTGKSQSDAIFELRKAGAQKPETTEYQLQQIIFVIPEDKRSRLMKARKAEAIAFSQQFISCEETYRQASQLRDVAVKELGRIMQPELPPLWADSVKATEVGKTTSPKETEKGVEILAVCKSRVTNDDRAAQVVTQSEAFTQLEEKGEEAGNGLLAELRGKSVVVRR
jgi:peptidyl-prolyl cis-trans isomerase SurA